MPGMRIFESKPALRWLVPVVAVGVVSGTSLIALSATADPALPPRTAEQLLVDLQQANVDEFSGVVTQTSDLGLPELPGLGSGQHDTSLTSLISGTRTLKVWSAGEDKQRLAILGTYGETDLIRNGNDVWNWSSQDNAATRYRLDPGQRPDQKPDLPSDAPKTPQEAADRVLAAIDPTTTVSTDRTVKVAGRDAYDLVLEPKQAGSLIRQVRLAVDAERYVPLRVQVFAAGADPVFEVVFTSISFDRPEDRFFAFNPPDGVKVTEGEAPALHPSGQPRTEDRPEPRIVGTGWAAVVVAKADLREPGPGSGEADQVLAALPRVSGSWGSGRLLTSKAFSALITDDGRIAAGAVAPEKLYDALG